MELDCGWSGSAATTNLIIDNRSLSNCVVQQDIVTLEPSRHGQQQVWSHCFHWTPLGGISRFHHGTRLWGDVKRWNVKKLAEGWKGTFVESTGGIWWSSYAPPRAGWPVRKALRRHNQRRCLGHRLGYVFGYGHWGQVDTVPNSPQNKTLKVRRQRQGGTREKQEMGTKNHKARTQQRAQRDLRTWELGWRIGLATRDKTKQ